MCGIIGYIGDEQAIPILLQGLKSLEYRGYDSAGVAFLEDGQLCLQRSKGKICALEAKINGDFGHAKTGIAHTRWATHGRPSDENSHPHTDCGHRIAVVHNGIIENYLELKEELEKAGHRFLSETDTEVIPHLIEELYRGDLLAAVQAALPKLRGSYAMVAISSDHPDMLIAARKDNPLIVGLGENENFFASDITAIINRTRRMMILQDGEVAVIRKHGADVYAGGKKIEKEVVTINWDAEASKKGGYDHFMLKEIHEQPWALNQTLQGRIEKGLINFHDFSFSAKEAQAIRKIAIVACGTAYHAGLVAKYAMEKLLRIPVDVDIASEFRYRDPLVDENTLLIVVSQSGETADTIAALREGKRKGARAVAITNVLGSTISREADDIIYTWAGPEIAVASTKAYLTQLVAIYLLTIYLGSLLGKISAAERQELIAAIYRLPHQVEEILTDLPPVLKELARQMAAKNDVFYLGRSMDYAVALEGALKMKEISYIRAEAYAAGELKHGTLALIQEDVPILALATQMDVYEKMVSNIKEVKARGASVIGITYAGNTGLEKVVDHTVYLPQTSDLFAPVLSVVPLQLLAYYTAVERGCDVDQPRNLAKSVTVE